MAHFRRNKPRNVRSRGYSAKALEYRIGPDWDGFNWLRSWPRDHDLTCHTRPRRRKTRALEILALRHTDPEELIWPLARKPHVYFW